MKNFGRMLADALEVVAVIIIILLAIVGLITLMNEEVRTPFIQILFDVSDYFKTLFK